LSRTNGLAQRQLRDWRDTFLIIAHFWQNARFVQASLETISRYAHPGCPGLEDQLQLLSYQLRGELKPDPAALEKIRTTFGKFTLATNEMDVQALPAREKLSHYKEQGIAVERGVRFLKDPLFFAHSLFLKSPARIMALIMEMGLALLIFALAERQLRSRLK